MIVSLVKRSSRRWFQPSSSPRFQTSQRQKKEEKQFRSAMLGWVAASVAFAVILAGTALSYLRG